MSFDPAGRGGLDYFPCCYGPSKTLFRGPQRPTDGAFIAVLGGEETYGRFIARPYPALLEEALDLPVVNLGWPNAGPDAFLSDPDLLALMGRARAVVIRLMGARNMSNRFYAVHPRRNDRFLQATGLMRSLYADVDFTEFNFTRQLLQALQAGPANRFAMLRAELQAAWVLRLEALIQRIPVPVLLFWFAGHERAEGGADIEQDPMFVTSAMVEALLPRVAGFVEYSPSAQVLGEKAAGKVFAPMEAGAAACGLPVAAHREAADALLPEVRRLLFR